MYSQFKVGDRVRVKAGVGAVRAHSEWVGEIVEITSELKLQTEWPCGTSLAKSAGLSGWGHDAQPVIAGRDPWTPVELFEPIEPDADLIPPAVRKIFQPRPVKERA